MQLIFNWKSLVVAVSYCLLLMFERTLVVALHLPLAVVQSQLHQHCEKNKNGQLKITHKLPQKLHFKVESYPLGCSHSCTSASASVSPTSKSSSSFSSSPLFAPLSLVSSASWLHFFIGSLYLMVAMYASLPFLRSW